ncbi:squalene--hopene cyclase [Neobacillus notoginsengisoli]|uniref:Squalene--hopene cyclase n=1 Tax=Neobacillus notoginsengisoli TaxID=1578198 RepID=A0A417YZE7_9BACI|nr:squalene--hopene cyclase [Neobacillus notoginsengisoli]RHW42887.1 squalene--hopene cyclase [Neobacillus notoginsengisoli]
MEDVQNGIDTLIEQLKQSQSPKGSWDFPFETGIATDCYMIILLKTLEIDDDNLIRGLAERILSRQEKNGAWKLFFDEGEGNLTATLEAYYALLFSGFVQKNDGRLRAARRFIQRSGGIEQAHMFTKIMLALTGQMKWPPFFPIPLEMILLPASFPLNFYSFSEFGRANLAPIMILADRKFQLRAVGSPDLAGELKGREKDGIEWFRDDGAWRGLESFFAKSIKNLLGLPDELHKLATEKTKNYMLDRIEPDGTFFGYFSSTFLMIFALLSLGFKQTDPVIAAAVEGLKGMKCEIDGFPHMQYTTATVWNTSLISYALQEAGVSADDPVVEKANRYLLGHQHYKYGDWAIHNPYAFPGGWGFADSNTIHPDVDDSTASLRAIAGSVQGDPNYQHAWERGTQWVLSMQNKDGGWPAFEKNTDSRLLSLFPIQKASFLLADPSSADLTGRTLEFLCNETNLDRNHPSVKAGVEWLLKNQEKDGSWYGRWGICYIYGTWAAVTGLRAAGVVPGHHAIERAVDWLKGIQNSDGGWGESCRSDSAEKYIPLGASTLTDTAWAVDALIAATGRPTKEIHAGIKYLLDNLDQQNWTTRYPKGQGMAGDFYIHYHSYNHFFPLLTLAHYKKLG